MAILVILLIVGLGYLCLYLGWKQGLRLGEKRALEQITYRAVLAEKNTQEEVKRRQSAEYQLNNQRLRADAWEKVAQEESLEEEKKEREKQQKDWEEFLHQRQHQGMGSPYWHQQMLAQQGTTGTYTNLGGLFGGLWPWGQ